MKKLLVVGWSIISCVVAFAQKTKDTSQIIQVDVSEFEEKFFYPHPEPPQDFISKYNSITDWLHHVADLKISAKQDAVYKIGFYRSQRNDVDEYIVYFRLKDSLKENLYSDTNKNFPTQFHSFPVDNLNWNQAANKISTEAKRFTASDQFKKSFLTQARTILTDNDEQVLWANPDLNIAPEIKRLRDITLALIEYNAAKNAGRLVFDGEDHHLHVASREKQQVEVYYILGNNKGLLYMLKMAAMPFEHDGNSDVNSYIKQNTGFDYDIFADARKTTESVLAKNKITSDEEASNASSMLAFYKKHPQDKKKADALGNLIDNYYREKRKSEKSNKEIAAPLPSNDYKELAELRSPNKKFSVHISESGKNTKTPQTHFQLSIHAVGGTTIYNPTGADLGIKAFWMDSNTFVIETKKEYKGYMKLSEVRSYNEVIKIQYVEQ